MPQGSCRPFLLNITKGPQRICLKMMGQPENLTFPIPAVYHHNPNTYVYIYICICIYIYVSLYVYIWYSHFTWVYSPLKALQLPGSSCVSWPYLWRPWLLLLPPAEPCSSLAQWWFIMILMKTNIIMWWFPEMCWFPEMWQSSSYNVVVSWNGGTPKASI
jgi:hypothetical protein